MFPGVSVVSLGVLVGDRRVRLGGMDLQDGLGLGAWTL